MNDQLSITRTAGWIALSLAVVVLLILGGVAGCGAYKGWQRGQARANAENRVAITRINIQNEQQQARVVTADNAVIAAQAEQKYIEATGIRRAQDEIAKTLTPLYIQHEAIQALDAVATSGRNNTVVYVPSGANGVPLVTNATNPSSLANQPGG